MKPPILMVSICVILLFCCISYPAAAQYYLTRDLEKIDSLTTLLDSSASDNAGYYIELSELYARYDSSVAIKYADKAFKIAERSNDMLGIARVYLSYAMNYHLNGKYAQSINSGNKAISILEELKNDRYLAVAYERLAFTHFWSMSDRDLATVFMKKALDYAISSGDSAYTARINLLLAGGVMRLGWYEEAMAYAQKHLELAERTTNIPRLHKGIGYAVAGDLYAYLGNDSLAIEYYRTALTCYDTSYVEDKALIQQSYGTMSRYFTNMGLKDSASRYLKMNRALSKEIFNTQGLIRYHTYMTRNLLSEGDRYAAASHLDSMITYCGMLISTGSYYHKKEYENLIGMSIDIFDPVSKSLRILQAWEQVKIGYGQLIEIYSSLGEYGKSLDYYRQYSAATDTIRKMTSVLELRSIQEKYETESKDRELASLKREGEEREIRVKQSSMLLMGLAFLVSLIITSLILFYRQYLLRLKQKAGRLEQKLFRLQMNPRFLFGALGSIRGYMETKDPDTVSVYLGNFSRLLRNVLEGSRKEFISLEEDQATTTNYLELQKLRFGDRFEFRFEDDPDLDIETVTVPPLIAHPYLEFTMSVLESFPESSVSVDVYITRKKELIHFDLTASVKSENVHKIVSYLNEKRAAGFDPVELIRQRLSLHGNNYRKSITSEEILRGDNHLERSFCFNVPFKTKYW